jgi:CDGSH-type Zn-finger protein
MNINVTKNKTEELMNFVRALFRKEKRKYLVICRTGNNRNIDYVDGTRDKEFLLKCKKHIDSLLKESK